jgi:hypothetical protein
VYAHEGLVQINLLHFCNFTLSAMKLPNTHGRFTLMHYITQVYSNVLPSKYFRFVPLLHAGCQFGHAVAMVSEQAKTVAR